MRRIVYQIKSVWRDKLCLLTFLLPIIAGCAISFLPDNGFSSLTEHHFGIVSGEMSKDTYSWLEGIGIVEEYSSLEELKQAVEEPATQLIGVLDEGLGIRTLIAGDEWEINKRIGDTLSKLFLQRELVEDYQIQIIREAQTGDELKCLLGAITIVTAMFMGCTFNAINIIGEKEDGIDMLQKVLPMTEKDYLTQKMMLGFAGSVFSSGVTAVLFVSVNFRDILCIWIMMGLSGVIAGILGILIGKISKEFMMGTILIKVVMLFFIVPPVFVYLTAPANSIWQRLIYLLPSGVLFDGCIKLLKGDMQNIVGILCLLCFHVLLWFFLYKNIKSFRNL